jgi:hypothetical protein
MVEGLEQPKGEDDRVPAGEGCLPELELRRHEFGTRDREALCLDVGALGGRLIDRRLARPCRDGNIAGVPPRSALRSASTAASPSSQVGAIWLGGRSTRPHEKRDVLSGKVGSGIGDDTRVRKIVGP